MIRRRGRHHVRRGRQTVLEIQWKLQRRDVQDSGSTAGAQ